MAAENERLQRLIADNLGECCAADVDRRLGELESLHDEAPLSHADDDVRALSALGNETRFRIVRLLATADDELCVCEFEPLLEVSASAISHALSNLTDAGLLARRKEGKWRYYRTTPLAERLLGALDTGRSDDTEGKR